MIEPDKEISLLKIGHVLKNRQHRTIVPTSTHIPAAVLILLKTSTEGPHVLLTERSDKVGTHKGQVSLPGGAKEPTDQNEVETALREAYEEIGLQPETVTVLGHLDDYLTMTGFHIKPVVAQTDSFSGLHPRSSEVEQVFSFPLSHLLVPGKLTRLPMRREGKNEDILFVSYQNHLIWGITARILWSLLEVTRWQ